jgi:hypothetical protein
MALIIRRSRWQNNKTQDVYNVWCVAKDSNGNEFVIYSKKPVDLEIKQHPIKHSETGMIGECEIVAGKMNFDWVVNFNVKVNGLDVNSVDVYARPLELWAKKFSLIA